MGIATGRITDCCYGPMKGYCEATLGYEGGRLYVMVMSREGGKGVI